MPTVKEWKLRLRDALKDALRARQPHAVSALRETLAALDNAEAADLSSAPPVEQGPIALGVAGLGRGDVPRKQLSPEEVAALIAREVADRLDAAKVYEAAGKGEVATALRDGARALDALRSKA